MKSILTLFSFIIFSIISIGQTTYVPDFVFENYLETNISGASNGVAGDHYVNKIPLEQLEGLEFIGTSISQISDLTGLEDFVQLKFILFEGPFLFLDSIDLNQYNLPLLEQISIWDGGALEYISFGSTSLKVIDIQSCTSLDEIIFGSNNLSDSANLHIIYCDSLKLIDFSLLNFDFETNLMLVGNAQLEQVILGQESDTNIVEFGFHLSPELHCIHVSNSSYFSNKLASNNTWWPEGYHQPNLYGFSENCENLVLGITNNLDELIKTEVGVFDLLGRKVEKSQSGIVLVYYNDGSFIRLFNP